MNSVKYISLILLSSTCALFGTNESAQAASSSGQELQNRVYSLRALTLQQVPFEQIEELSNDEQMRNFIQSITNNAFVKYLEELSIDPKHKNKPKDTSWFSYAISNDLFNIARAWIIAKQDLKLRELYPLAIPRYDAPKKQIETINNLLETGINLIIQQKNETGTLLADAIRDKQITIARKLIEFGADLNKQNEHGKTALMLSFSHFFGNNIFLFNTLIKAGADLNKKDSDGNTALMLALKRKKVIEAEALIKAGADLTIKNNENLTALDLAEKYELTKEVIDTMNEKMQENSATASSSSNSSAKSENLKTLDQAKTDELTIVISSMLETAIQDDSAAASSSSRSSTKPACCTIQ